MKFRYDKEDDVLMVWFSHKKVDYADQAKDIIIHYTKDEEPVLLEILRASSFLSQTSISLPRALKEQIFA